VNDRSCETVRDLLVDYADGELSPERAEEVRAHLSACPSCREQVRALHESLALARSVWNRSAQEAHGIAVPRERKRYRALTRLAAVAAGIALLVGGAVAWLARGPAPNSGPGVTPSIVSEADARKVIRREVAAAKLAASAAILESQPGGAKYAANSWRFIVDTYPETKAGKAAVARLSPRKEDDRWNGG